MNISLNLSDEHNEEKVTEFFTTNEIITGAVILVVLMFLAIIGNVLTCLIICRKSNFRSSTNISILFLSISDISMASLVMPFSVASLIKERWIFSSEACTFNAFLFHFLLGVSLITMTCTAVIRHLCVVKHTFHHQYAKPKNVAIGISIFWLIYCLLQVILVLLSPRRGTYNPKQIYCLYHRPRKDVRETINYIGLAGAVILGLLIFLAYFKVFRFVSHHNNTVALNLQQGNNSHIEEAKLTKTLVIVVLGFAACWTPVITIHFINMLGRYQYQYFSVPNFVFLFQTICIFFSSAINPLIYAFTNKRFRKEYFELLRLLLPSRTQIVPAVVA